MKCAHTKALLVQEQRREEEEENKEVAILPGRQMANKERGSGRGKR
jgi:hypothetical protein